MPAGAWVTTQFFDGLGRLRKSTAVSVVQAGTNILGAITNRDGSATPNPTTPGTRLVLAPGQAGGIDSNGNFQCWAPIGDYEVFAGSNYLGCFTVAAGGGGGGGIGFSAATPVAVTVGGHAVGVDPGAPHADHSHDLGAHAVSHETGGSDVITPASIGAPTTAQAELKANKAQPSGYASLDGGGQVPLSQLGNAPGGAGGGSPTGSAGGDLAGAYPNPIVRAARMVKVMTYR